MKAKLQLDYLAIIANTVRSVWRTHAEDFGIFPGWLHRLAEFSKWHGDAVELGA